MRGLYINTNSGITNDLGLLARRPGVEIMTQVLKADATVWLSPSQISGTFEFFYVLTGRIRLLTSEGAQDICVGGSFYADWLENEVQIAVPVDTTLLYVTNKPLFDTLSSYQDNLRRLLIQVNEKDHSTYNHSRNVMRYSVKIANRLARENSDIEDLVNASLFHDIGKCFTPDEILKKPARLTDEELFIMRKHPIDSARLLEPIFGHKVSEIAGSHHELLDGSGYPLGLKGNQLCMESRIICVADCFDAMTSKRVYCPIPKEKLAAVNELCSMPNKYDSVVCAALKALVEDGTIDEEVSLPIQFI